MPRVLNKMREYRHVIVVSVTILLRSLNINLQQTFFRFLRLNLLLIERDVPNCYLLDIELHIILK